MAGMGDVATTSLRKPPVTPRAHSRASRRQLVWFGTLLELARRMGSRPEGACNNRNREQEDQPDSQRAARQRAIRGKRWDTPQIHLHRITRESYQDWKDRFYPKQKELMELATNGKLLQDSSAGWMRTTPTPCVLPSRLRQTAMPAWG